MVEVVTVDHLTKNYRSQCGVQDITFSVESGTVFGLLGPNNSGKSTIIRTLLGFLKPSSGTIHVFGLPVQEDFPALKQDIGYVPEQVSLYPYLTGRQMLLYLSRLRNNSVFLCDELVDYFQLPLDKRIREYSQPLKQKLGIVQACMHDPELIVLDEPSYCFSSYDQQQFISFLAEQKKKGKTMIIASKNISELESLCDLVGLLSSGKLLTVDTIDRLHQMKNKLLKAKRTGKKMMHASEGKP